MKVITPQEMAHLESLAYLEEAYEVEFMQNAGEGVAAVVDAYIQKHQLGKHILLLCGKGNNTGDGYVAAIHLLRRGYEVQALQLIPIASCSHLCQHYFARFLNAQGVWIQEADLSPEFFASYDLIIDGIFGTGFHGQVDEPFASMIRYANESRRPIIAIDIPSGLNGETGVVEGEAIIAAETAFLELPKRGFFVQKGWNFVGRLTGVDFGLPEKFVEGAKSPFEMICPNFVKPFLPPIVKVRDKYQAGYMVGLAGSPGMPGAAMLASSSALKSGAGIIRLLHPENMQAELACSLYEIIKTSYGHDPADGVVEHLNKASAVFVGPGLGRTDAMFKLLRAVLPRIEKPCVIDADALYFLAMEETELPSQTILTPHLGEMMRLFKQNAAPTIDGEFLQRCQRYAESRRATLILKGGPTWIFHPGQPILVNPYGDPGMATAGSGDVLTGILASLLAQGLGTREAAALGTFLHGYSGQIASDAKTPYCMIASDITEYLPQAFALLSR